MNVTLNLEEGSARKTMIVDAVEWYRFLERLDVHPRFELPAFLGGLVLGLLTGLGLLIVLTWLRIL
jgi:hypothetical protein